MAVIAKLAALAALSGCASVTPSKDEDRPRDDAGGPDAAQSSGSAMPPATPRTGACPSPAPLEPIAGEDSEACWDIPDAPTADACPKSAAEEFATRCCVPGGCGFDFGDGCTFEPGQLVADLDPSAAVCAGGEVERVFEGELDQVSLSPDALFVSTRNPASSTTFIAHVDKDSCETSVPYEGPTPPGRMQSVGELVYVVLGNGDELVALDAGGRQEPIDLASLLDAEWLSIGWLGTDGKSLFAQVYYAVAGAAELEERSTLIEVPCCGEAPRVVVADGVPTGSSRTEVSFDGTNLVVVQEELVLDAGPLSSALLIDPTTGASTPLIESFQGHLLPSVLVDGVLYVGRDRALTSLALDDCASEPLVILPEAQHITAMTGDDTWLYWAEDYAGLSGARVFRMQPGGKPERLVQTATSVSWLGVDAHHLYWREQGLLARRALAP
jgi:hypothetical protein